MGETDDLPYLDLAWKFSEVVRGQPSIDQVTFAHSTSVVSVADSYVREPMRPCAPLLKPQEGVAALKAYAQAAEQAWNVIDPTHPDSGFTLACHVVFGLCETLWGKLENFNENASEYAVQMRRKQMLVSWLEKAIEAELSVGRKHPLPEKESMEKIFRHVSDGKIDLAVKSAVETGNTHLATMLASSCSASVNPVAVTKQLVEWIETEADTFVSNSALKLYCLLAAKPTWLSCQGIINTCEGLDWKRSLLFHLTFLTEPVSLISDGVLMYEAAWKGKSEFQVYSAAPVPAYVERSREDVVINPDERDECPLRDMCYHLIKLYCERSHRLDTTLSPSSVVPHPLDYRVSWHVWRLLYSAGYGSGMKSTTIASLHFSYAAQLESRGLWHQAVFVLMHLDNSRRREMAIRSLLGRYVFSDAKRNQEQESFVVDELGVPEIWLHECCALHAKTRKADHQVAYYLLKANHWQSAHNALMKGVVADSLIHDHYDHLNDLLTTFVKENATGCVKDWDVAGKVYLDFLTLTKHIKNVEQNVTSAREIESELEDIWPRVSTLCKQVADLKCYSAKDRLARAEIAQQTLNLYNVMNLMLKQHELPSPYEKTSHFSSVPSSVVALQTTKMCLPEDYAIQDLAKIVENHFIELKTIKKHEL